MSETTVRRIGVWIACAVVCFVWIGAIYHVARREWGWAVYWTLFAGYNTHVLRRIRRKAAAADANT